MKPLAYYNENDSYCAAWLKNLIAQNLIAPGDVDDRDIRDVQPIDLVPYTQCHFFAGIGGWSLALRLAAWPDHRPVWTGSCPCQPFSAAGKRGGAGDDRHLWPYWFWLIRQRKPSIVLGEQVEAAVRQHWLDAVFADLEAEGYACGASVLPACGVGAPHIRQRCWFVADAMQPTSERRAGSLSRAQAPQRSTRVVNGHRAERPSDGRETHDLADAALRRCREQPAESGRSPWADPDWLPCTDGKVRPVEPGTFPLVAGVSESLGRLRTIEDQAFAEVVAYGTASKTDADQVLHLVWDSFRTQARGQGCSTGMCLEFHAAEILFDFLFSRAAAFRRTADEGSVPKTRDEASQKLMRMLRSGKGTCSSPCGLQSDEQRRAEPPDALHLLSFVLARHAQAYRQAAADANAADGRVGRLRAYGNAIVPQLAAEFIQAVMDARP